MNMRWLNFPFQPNINVETTLGHQHWINVTLSTLFQRCFVNVETTSINIRRLNFHFQPNFNVETTLVHRRWIDVILSTLFQRCFANVETTSINVRRLNFHFQPNINVDVFAGKLVLCAFRSRHNIKASKSGRRPVQKKVSSSIYFLYVLNILIHVLI